MEFFIRKLPNGIRAIHKRVKSNVVYIAITINAGSRDENEQEHGVAHLTEHLLFKGTESRKAHHINSRLENLGGELNAFTTKEETVIHATALKSDLNKAMELLADVVFRSTFDAKEVAKEREIIFDEINLYKDSPSEMIFDEFEDLLFSGSSFGHNILGTKATLKKLNRESLIRFVDRTYNTDNIIVSVIGNVSEKRFEQALERYFGSFAISTRSFDRETPASIAPFNTVINKGRMQSHAIIGSTAYNLYDEKRLPLALLINTLGGPLANSILNSVVRERYGLTYNIEANYSPFSDSGVASIYFTSEKDNVDRCLELIDKEVRKIKDGGLTPRRLSISKRQFVGQLSIAMENSEAYMLSAAKSLLCYDVVDTPETIFKKVDLVNNSDIMEVANEIFSNTSSLIYR